MPKGSGEEAEAVKFLFGDFYQQNAARISQLVSSIEEQMF